MLIPNLEVSSPDPVLALIAKMEGKPAAEQLRTGMYLIGHFSSSNSYPQFEHYPGDLPINCCGVCDHPEQVIQKCPELEMSQSRHFFVTFTCVKKSTQPPDGGWRWHKWGEYIGEKSPQHEYIYDEDDSIQEVYCYHIYERKNPHGNESN